MSALLFDIGWLKIQHVKYPWRALAFLLIPAGIALYLFALRRRSKLSMRYSNTSILSRVMPSQKNWVRHLAVGLSLLTIVTLTIAFMVPLAKDKVPRERATVVVVIDVSMSMESADVAPTRLAAAKQTSKELISSLPDTFNVAVVELAGNSSLILPPTTDRLQANAAIDGLTVREGTSIGDAIAVSLTALDQVPVEPGDSPVPASVVILSDGGDATGPMQGKDPMAAAQEAKGKKVQIYTVAYGTQTGYVDVDGERQIVAPNTSLLESLADATGGDALQADGKTPVTKLWKSLNSSVGYAEVDKEVTARWAGLGLVFGALAALAAVMLAARWPQ